jgi:hypothetical protein
VASVALTAETTSPLQGLKVTLLALLQIMLDAKLKNQYGEKASILVGIQIRVKGVDG